MATMWSITIDCAHPARLAEFWALALGYVEPPPPTGFAAWEQWQSHYDIPAEEWEEGAYLIDPEGLAPKMSFLQVPEAKLVKNRLHLDVQAGGGRDIPWEIRWPRVIQVVDRLTTAGAAVLREDTLQGKPDHVVMADPEGNEFCVL